jgi:hypothetical protein
MALEMLQAGVDRAVIALWLGHVDTTNIYAEVDLEMKSKALARCDISTDDIPHRWRAQPKLMTFLKSL